jgi:hypothetical protein
MSRISSRFHLPLVSVLIKVYSLGSNHEAVSDLERIHHATGRVIPHRFNFR